MYIYFITHIPCFVSIAYFISFYVQSKFHSSRRGSDPSTQPPHQPSHGVCVGANPIVVLNALGYIGFKVVSTCGDAEVWCMVDCLRYKTVVIGLTFKVWENAQSVAIIAIFAWSLD